MKICEKCNLSHDGSYGSGRFCCQKCARAFASNTNKKEANKKTSETLLKRNLEKTQQKMQRICMICKCSFTHSRRKTCSKACHMNCYRTIDVRKKLSEKGTLVAKMRHDRGDDFGWQTRKNFKPSYPETIAMSCLKAENICFEREHKVGKYFIDFAIVEKLVAIEIDGQQHEKPDRILSDLKKDEYLSSLGWKVFRIKWPHENIIESTKKILLLI